MVNDSRRSILIGAATIGGLGAAAAAAATWKAHNRKPAPAGTRRKVTYLTSFGLFGRDAYALVAEDEGYFDELGIEVDIRPGTGTDNVKQVDSGQAQFAAVDFTGGLLAAHAGDLDVRAVALIQQKSLAAIFAPKSSGITGPKDLEGKRVGSIPADVVKLLFPTYAGLAGVDPSKVTFVNGTPQTLPVLLATKKVDAINQFVVGQGTIERAIGEQIVVLPYSDYITDLLGNALWVSAETIRRDPGLVRDFRTALLRGLAEALKRQVGAGFALRKRVPATDPILAGGEMRDMVPYALHDGQLGHIEPHRIAQTIALLQAAEAIPAGLTPERFVDLSFL
jgi:NitT/TauT family transport system substrate-binding protein